MNTSTSAFLIWSLHVDCQIKEDGDSVDLVGLERRLRPLRSLGVAEREDRIIDMVCMDRPSDADFEPLESVKAFSVPEIIETFGGKEFLQGCCKGCAANVCAGQRDFRSSREFQFAGCYGYIFDRYDSIQRGKESLTDAWRSDLGSGSGEFSLLDCWNEILLAKQETAPSKPCDPPVYGLWRTEILSMETTVGLLDLIAGSCPEVQALPDLVDFGRALRASLQSEKECPQSLPIKVQFVPAGRIANRFWYLPQHCCSCKAVCEPWKGRCPVCQSSDPPLPPRKRHLRGDRPYWPLVRFLGSEGAKNLVKKYTRGKSL